MASQYKTPNVYIEEISTFPPTVVEGATAVPAFIGYTEKAGNKKQNDVYEYHLKPVRVSSMAEYKNIFGEAYFPPSDSGSGVNENDSAVITVKLKSNDNKKFEVNYDSDKLSQFLLYYQLEMYFSNGGSVCYIVSVGQYGNPNNVPMIQPTDFEYGLKAVEKEDEPTLIVLTDAIKLEINKYYGVCTQALDLCAKLKDRFTILDIKRTGAGYEDDIKTFRDKIGQNNLKYGAAYFPYLNTTIPQFYNDEQFKGILHLPSYVDIDDKDGYPALRIEYPNYTNPQVQIKKAKVRVDNKDSNFTIHLPNFNAKSQAKEVCQVWNDYEGDKKALFDIECKDENKIVTNSSSLQLGQGVMAEGNSLQIEYFGDDANKATIVQTIVNAEAKAEVKEQTLTITIPIGIFTEDSNTTALASAIVDAFREIANVFIKFKDLNAKIKKIDLTNNTFTLKPITGVLHDQNLRIKYLGSNSSNIKVAIQELEHFEVEDGLLTINIADKRNTTKKISEAWTTWVTNNGKAQGFNIAASISTEEVIPCAPTLLETVDFKTEWVQVSTKIQNVLEIQYPNLSSAPKITITASSQSMEINESGGTLEIKTKSGIDFVTVEEIITKWNEKQTTTPLLFSITKIGNDNAKILTRTDKSLILPHLGILKTRNSKLYFEIKEKLDKLTVTLPPSGAIAGVYASVDQARGVWKAPANVSINNVISPLIKLTDFEQEDLNVHDTGKSINVIRSFTGKGTLVWGSRTLAGNDNEWKYVSVRRLFNLIEKSIKKATAFAVFEPNSDMTWLKVRVMIDNYLNELWSQGALAGAKAEDAYFVHVGLGKTMTAQDILEGKMITKIGVAAVRPAEFIIMQFSHLLQRS